MDPGLEAFLIDHKVEISAEPIAEAGSPVGDSDFGFWPGAPLDCVLCLDVPPRRQQGGGMSGLMGIGRSKARRYDQEKERK